MITANQAILNVKHHRVAKEQLIDISNKIEGASKLGESKITICIKNMENSVFVSIVRKLQDNGFDITNTAERTLIISWEVK